MGRHAIETSIESEASSQTARTGNRFESTDKDGRGIPLRSGHQVEHFVDSVDQIDVPDSTRAEHDRVARGASPGGVTGLITRSVVGFDFRDEMSRSGCPLPEDQGFAQQRLCQGNRVGGLKFGERVNSGGRHIESPTAWLRAGNGPVGTAGLRRIPQFHGLVR